MQPKYSEIFFKVFFIIYFCLGAPVLKAATYAAYVMDANTGRIHHAHNSQTLVHPASLTKMMTLFILFEELERKRLTLMSVVKFSQKAASQSPSKLGVPAGQGITVKEALLALLARSANDVAMAVAETISGNEQAFVSRMNITAKSLGMEKTEFRNPHGLPNKHQVTTARDMARLSQALLKKFPHYYQYFRTKSFNYKGQKIHNHNKLLGRVEGLDGIKTGFTCASGFNIATSATRNGQRLIGVVMGGETSQWRNTRVSKLLETAFAQSKNLQRAHAPKTLLTVASENHLSKIDWENLAAHSTREMKNSTQQDPEPTLSTSYSQSQEITTENINWETLGAQSETDAESAIVVKDQETLSEIAPPPTRTWFVQIGTYKNAGDAQKNASKILATLPKDLESKIVITPASRQKNKFYQAKLGGYDKITAIKISKTLKKKGINCLIDRQV